jgi:reactive chlorine resistance protein C
MTSNEMDPRARHGRTTDVPKIATAIQRAAYAIALVGIVLPLLMIGGLKFTQLEVDALKPLISGTPWLAWMYPVFGETGASWLLGVIEIGAALLLATSPWSPKAGVAGAAIAATTFAVTTSLLLTPPPWEASLGGFPALSPFGQFLIKDIALLGISLVVLGQCLSRVVGSPWAEERSTR